MRFTEEQINAARRLRDAGLPWNPGPGDFVYDERGLVERPSPFQDRVYFILDLRHFLRRAGTVERLKQAMFWLPQWQQARQLLRDLGVGDVELAAMLEKQNAIASGRELLALYERIRQALESGSRAG
jgi:hypothetical protein